MWYILCVLAGIAIGCIISAIKHKRYRMSMDNVGVLNVVESDDGESPYLFVELNQDARYLFDKKRVLMSVKSIYSNSQN